ncbi:macrophage mannose receptor 1-like isoform X1 [Ruditapes philippinarum]|uniref:macrophage mannose receptor 1-like isoform X1 n=1 Tax=Ruditapes philippinarum TaxID=129788 RepID=UPI00295BF15B|nr:macrophage mannose receptor 1-like isoform X1 [Ruditapes philippinarum]
MRIVLCLLVLCCTFVTCNGVRCFECKDVPYPRDCSNAVTCGQHEQCSTEQFNSSGNIVYNTGCLATDRCSTANSLILGKRSANITLRTTGDISTCIECCSGEFCNNKGCGTDTVPINQRGPYCFSCDALIDPKACSKVSVCAVNEECLLYSPAEYNGLPETVYKSQCESRAACDVMTSAFTNTKCPPSCCKTDFCNDKCGNPTNNTMSTPVPANTQGHVSNQPIVQVTTQTPVIVTSQGSCKQDHLYDDITGMCIKIDETRLLNHADAKKACEAIGDHLVTIDMHEKTVFIENMIMRHSNLEASKRLYCIGAFDKHDNSVFYWPNGHQIFYTNWGGGDEVAHNRQPDDNKHSPQNCVIIYGPDYYRWHVDKCENKWHFICEDRTTLKANIAHHTGATDTVTNPIPTHHTNTFQCDTHDGYMDLERDGTHLCVKIVTHKRNWDGARSDCKHSGGDLVVLDTSVKARMMRMKLVHDGHYNHQTGFWIGAKDFHLTNKFSWVNNHPVTNGDWYSGQPNHHDGGHDQDCACMWSTNEHYHWHDDYCAKTLGYICERK